MGRIRSWRNRILFILLGISTAFIQACNEKESSKLIIATAANAQYAINAIRKNFTAETGIETDIIISSSGKHTAQIEAGAPYDIFISADLKYPESLYQKGLTTASPKVYAYGRLVLWSVNDGTDVNIKGITSKKNHHIAMPNPKTAPYGRAAKETLDYYNLYDSIKDKLVLGSSVAQTSQFILTDAADLGFTAASIVMAPAMKGKGTWQEIDNNTYSAIAQGAVIIKNSTHLEQSKKFYNYLYSGKAQKIIAAYGYGLYDSIK